jgi:hypothetical protein
MITPIGTNGCCGFNVNDELSTYKNNGNTFCLVKKANVSSECSAAKHVIMYYHERNPKKMKRWLYKHLPL